MNSDNNIREQLEQEPGVDLPSYERPVQVSPKLTQAELRKDIECTRCMDIGFAQLDMGTNKFTPCACPDCGKEADV